MFATPTILSLAHRKQWYDERNHRKIHTDDTPRLGGVGIYLSFVITAVTGLLILDARGMALPGSVRMIAFLFAGVSIMHFMGLYDDFVNLRAVVKLVVQLAAAVVVVAGGTFIRSLDLPFLTVAVPPALGAPLTVVWLVAIANAVNLVDGADGLAGTISGSAALFMGLIALSRGNVGLSVIAFALFGAVAGFLVYNFPPARIFMGDSGSLLLGFVLAIIPVVGFAPGDQSFALLPVLTILFLPVFDTLLAIGRRITRRQPVHTADREHIHHRLIDRDIHGSRLLGIVVIAMGLLGVTGMLWYTVPATIATVVTACVWISAIVVAAFLRHPAG